jgi:hypothetical protein
VEASTGRALAALLFITYALAALDAFSSVHSSPYTAEVRGGEPTNAERVWRYAKISAAVAAVLGIGGVAISGKAWPLVGVTVGGGFMLYLYRYALMQATCDTEEIAG